jgi:hypothetical protein
MSEEDGLELEIDLLSVNVDRLLADRERLIVGLVLLRRQVGPDQQDQIDRLLRGEELN